jgi:hypothetical protein
VPLGGKFLLIALVIVRITLNVSASNVPKCLLKNGIVQKLVSNLSNTSTMLFPPVAFKWHKMASNYDLHSPPCVCQLKYCRGNLISTYFIRITIHARFISSFEIINWKKNDNNSYTFFVHIFCNLCLIREQAINSTLTSGQ